MKKTLRSLHQLSRLQIQSHFRSILSPEHFNTLAAYSPKNVLAWVTNVGKYWFTNKHPFVVYPGNLTGITKMFSNVVTICAAGDWGTGTKEADEVGKQIRLCQPHYTIHLGDVYYVGNNKEVGENFFGVKNSDFDPVAWPQGSEDSFALVGNHEMYAKGYAYFDKMLPALDQKASYFCLENDYWRIIGLDTGYNSTGLEFGPFKPSCKIPEQVIDWLKTLNLNLDNRGIILMTHHQPFSSFEHGYETPMKQLDEIIAKPVLWFWGHEHRMAVYAQYGYSGPSAVWRIYGRCVGHGGMPVSLKKPDHDKSTTLLFSDQREYPNDEGLKVGYNGFARFDLNKDALVVKYKDLNGAVVYSENWTLDKLK